MVEAILTHIQKIEDLKVKSRTSVEQYRNPDKDLTVIASELKVAFILEGSVQKVGENIRITAQLIEGSSGDHLWAENYDGKYTDEIFAFQSDVARRVASSLQAVITPIEEERINFKPTDNMEAYDLFMRGWEMIEKWRDIRDRHYLDLAMNLFNQALKIDPIYGEALSSKGSVYLEGGKYDSALYYFDKTIKLYPDIFLPYGGKGHLYMYMLNEPDSAYKYISRAHDIAPNFPWNNILFGQYYQDVKNDYIKAILFYQRAYELEGEDDLLNRQIGLLYLEIGYYDISMKYYKQALQLSQRCSNINWIRYNFLFQGNNEEALHFLDSICDITACEQECALSRFYFLSMNKEFDQAEQYYNQFINNGGKPSQIDSIWLAYVYRAQTRDLEVIAILNKVKKSIENQLSQNRSFNRIAWLSVIYAIMDEKEESLRYLSEASSFNQWFTWFEFLTICPIYENLWDDPEFKTIIRQNKEKMERIQTQIRQMRERGEISF
jgi:tetratricopeptide (TPR) repeat protein